MAALCRVVGPPIFIFKRSHQSEALSESNTQYDALTRSGCKLSNLSGCAFALIDPLGKLLEQFNHARACLCFQVKADVGYLRYFTVLISQCPHDAH
jgi:hypothetical protein